MKKMIINCQTGEQISSDLSDAEKAEMEACKSFVIDHAKQVFDVPLYAPSITVEEVILQSPIPKGNPEAALTRAKNILALKEKPIGEMLFNLLVVVADIVTRLDKLDKKRARTQE